MSKKIKVDTIPQTFFLTHNTVKVNTTNEVLQPKFDELKKFLLDNDCDIKTLFTNYKQIVKSHISKYSDSPLRSDSPEYQNFINYNFICIHNDQIYKISFGNIPIILLDYVKEWDKIEVNTILKLFNVYMVKYGEPYNNIECDDGISRHSIRGLICSSLIYNYIKK